MEKSKEEGAEGKWKKWQREGKASISRCLHLVDKWKEQQSHALACIDALSSYEDRRAQFSSISASHPLTPSSSSPSTSLSTTTTTNSGVGSDGGVNGRGKSKEGGGGGGGSIYEHRPAAVKAVREMAASITVAVVESEGNLIAGWKDASQDMKETSKELSSEVSSSSSLLRIQAEAIPFAWLGEVSTVLSLPLLEAVEVMEVIASDIAKEVLCQGRIISTLPTLDKAKQGHARRLWKEQRYVRWSYVEKLRQALSLPSSKKGEEEEGGG